MPVSQMGNYQEYLKRIPSPLREVESTPVRQHTFGNPFKIDKVSFRRSLSVLVFSMKLIQLEFSMPLQRMIIDEADMEFGSGNSPQRNASRRTGTPDVSVRASLKRKPGPIPRNVQLKKRCISPVSSPLSSPPLSPAPLCLHNGDLGKCLYIDAKWTTVTCMYRAIISLLERGN